MAYGERLRSSSAGSGHSEIGQPCACGRAAVVEKGGRTVCRACAEGLRGREFPLRTGLERCSFGSNLEKIQLDMLEIHGGRATKFYGHYLG